MMEQFSHILHQVVIHPQCYNSCLQITSLFGLFHQLSEPLLQLLAFLNQLRYLFALARVYSSELALVVFKLLHSSIIECLHIG